VGAAAPAPVEVPLALEAADAAALLVDFLNELIYRADAEGLVLDAFELERCDERGLRGRARGSRTAGAVPVKAATFHGLVVTRSADGALEARVVLDI
jgi:SHS2 domain-containing protein